jgi:hypothetical protein
VRGYADLGDCGMDWAFDIGTSVSPLLAIVGYVHLFVNSKSATFETDIMLFLIWGAKAWLSMAGALDRPAVPRTTLAPKSSIKCG